MTSRREPLMPLYHLLLDTTAFHDRIRPALSAAWLRRSFGPCRALCEALLPAARSFADRYRLGPEEPLLARAARGLTFDRDFWRHLVGEVLWFSASEIPEFETAPESLRCLLAPERHAGPTANRERFAPIEQAHYGARDLVFGGACYRPDQAGYNDTPDVERLAAYLDALAPETWTAAGLAALEGVEGEADRAEELEYVRDWFPSLRELYRRARERREVVVCEIL
jgi:hypothetical protein